MKYMLAIALSFTPAFAVGADDPQAAKATPSKDAESTKQFSQEGIWKPKGALLDGVFLPPPSLKAITLVVKKGTYRVTIEGEEEPDEGTFEVDTSVSPKRMTIKSNSGPNKGKTFLAIYEMKNEISMRVCYDLSGKEFPKEFKAPKGSGRYLVGYRKQVTPTTDK